MKNGLVYPLIKWVIMNFNKISLVEKLKVWSKHPMFLIGEGEIKQLQLRNTRVAVDLFIIFKWLYIFLLVATGATNILFEITVWYLIATNLHTYLYYHFWADENFNRIHADADRMRRRFTNLMLAVVYSNICFAYLYYGPYHDSMQWVTGSFQEAIWYSVSNSLTASYLRVSPLTPAGDTLSIIHLVVMFIFITVVIGRQKD